MLPCNWGDRAERLREQIATRTAALADKQRTLDRVTTIHRIFYGIKTVLPKTSETVGLLYVHTPIDLAYHFLCRRTDQAIPLSAFLQIRSAPVEQEIEESIAEADAVLYNWTGRPAYRRTIQALMAELHAPARRT